jgi:malonate-semialdehyde dehydrogenase (acetylating) / methylmalonate-semialdehyde dehydrogenase
VALTTRIVADSAFGNAGQRCLAASLAITVAGAEKVFVPALAEAASNAWWATAWSRACRWAR